jgi:hypothetical protein
MAVTIPRFIFEREIGKVEFRHSFPFPIQVRIEAARKATNSLISNSQHLSHAGYPFLPFASKILYKVPKNR